MISAIKGTIFAISPGEIHVDTGYGFIVKVLFPVSTYSKIKNREKKEQTTTVSKLTAFCADTWSALPALSTGRAKK